MPAKDSGLLGRWPRQAHHSLAQSSMSGCTDVTAPERYSLARLRRSITLCGALQKARQSQSDSPGSGWQRCCWVLRGVDLDRLCRQLPWRGSGAFLHPESVNSIARTPSTEIRRRAGGDARAASRGSSICGAARCRCKSRIAQRGAQREPQRGNAQRWRSAHHVGRRPSAWGANDHSCTVGLGPGRAARELVGEACPWLAARRRNGRRRGAAHSLARPRGAMAAP